MSPHVTKVEFATSMSQINNRFDGIDERMNKIDQKFDESTETTLKQFDRMYDYMNSHFAKVYEKLHLLDLIVEHLGIKTS